MARTARSRIIRQTGAAEGTKHDCEVTELSSTPRLKRTKLFAFFVEKEWVTSSVHTAGPTIP
jgi:hypothetical protein